MAIWMTATFGIFCTKPLYLGLLVYVAVIGSVAYGALALGAYGLGLATTVALGGLVLIRATRAARLAAWLAAHEETFHLVQGIMLAVVGGMAVAFFWLRYIIPPT
jgi:cytochrome c biogenesis protein CcdA